MWYFHLLEAGFSFEHLSWLTSDMTSLRFTKRVRAWGPLRFMVNPQFESKLMRIKVHEITEKKGQPLYIKIWLLEGRRWYKMMTLKSKLYMVWGVGFLSKDGRWMLFSSLRLQSAPFQRNVCFFEFGYHDAKFEWEDIRTILPMSFSGCLRNPHRSQRTMPELWRLWQVQFFSPFLQPIRRGFWWIINYDHYQNTTCFYFP